MRSALTVEVACSRGLSPFAMEQGTSGPRGFEHGTRLSVELVAGPRVRGYAGSRQAQGSTTSLFVADTGIRKAFDLGTPSVEGNPGPRTWSPPV